MADPLCGQRDPVGQLPGRAVRRCHRCPCTTGTSLGMENLLVTSSTALDADSRAALEQAAADAGVKHVVVHDTAAFR